MSSPEEVVDIFPGVGETFDWGRGDRGLGGKNIGPKIKCRGRAFTVAGKKSRRREMGGEFRTFQTVDVEIFKKCGHLWVEGTGIDGGHGGGGGGGGAIKNRKVRSLFGGLLPSREDSPCSEGSVIGDFWSIGGCWRSSLNYSGGAQIFRRALNLVRG